MKKSNNPFKMLGSWIGAIAPTILLIILQLKLEGRLAIGPLLLVAGIGFLFGWGIETLIKRLTR